jgi:hypothetical protein
VQSALVLALHRAQQERATLSSSTTGLKTRRSAMIVLPALLSAMNGANPFDYLTELQRHAEELERTPSEWMPWNYRETVG